MRRESKRTYILTTIVCLIPIIVALVIYKKLPDQVVTHWDGEGNPNGYASKFVGAILFPGILLVINLLFPLLLKMDPKYQNQSAKVTTLLHWIIPFVALYASGVTLAAALGFEVKTQFYGMVFVGLILTVIGNYLPKVSQSYTVGIKIPWTLNDEENWNKTHRMAGFLWTICGILIIISAFLPQVGEYTFLGIVLVMVIVPCVYSYLLHVKKK